MLAYFDALALVTAGLSLGWVLWCAARACDRAESRGPVPPHHRWPASGRGLRSE